MQPQLAHGVGELVDRCIEVLHRQRREAHEPIGGDAHELGHGLVVDVAERHRVLGRDVVEVGEWVGRQHLEVDAGGVHRVEAHLRVHVERPAVLDAAQGVTTHTEPLLTALVEQLGAVLPRCSEHQLEHHVRVNVDHRFLPPEPVAPPASSA
ncbi:MAG: hypothetical protein HZB15_04860 [Actinobacteria bacterium]|nr:hypothetical protein [Actinomycetota bacterium]